MEERQIRSSLHLNLASLLDRTFGGLVKKPLGPMSDNLVKKLQRPMSDVLVKKLHCPMSGGLVKKRPVYESLVRPIYQRRQVAKGVPGHRMKHPLRNDLHSSGRLRSDSSIALFRIPCGLRTAATVFTCPDLSPPQIQSMISIHSLKYGQRDQSHQLYRNSLIFGDLVLIKARNLSGLVRNLTRVLDQVTSDQDRMDLSLPAVLR